MAAGTVAGKTRRSGVRAARWAGLGRAGQTLPGDRWWPGAVSSETAPSHGWPPSPHQDRFLPTKNLGGCGGQSPPAADNAAAAGRRPLPRNLPAVRRRALAGTTEGGPCAVTPVPLPLPPPSAPSAAEPAGASVPAPLRYRLDDRHSFHLSHAGRCSLSHAIPPAASRKRTFQSGPGPAAEPVRELLQ